MALENIHIKYLKDYIDQLIINQGILQVKNPELVIEKIKVDFLVKLAFRFYSKLYSSEKYASYLRESEKENFINSDKEYQPILQCMFSLINTRKQEKEVQCLNCATEIPLKELSISGDNLPICSDCQLEIGLEMDIWEKVFG
ncbi:MAG: hypothetical protein FWG98_04680 [Candidatus Cloacimonetes bacterium]|nr:hypothetical protein [Candidatus Cloacimonadota bacterium]